MREQRDKNEVLKWFLIFNIVFLICKALIFMCKAIIIAICKVLGLTVVGIRMAYPKMKEKTKEYKEHFVKYRTRIKDKASQVKCSFVKMGHSISNKIAFTMLKMKENLSKRENAQKQCFVSSNKNISLKLKKTKYQIIEFWYNHEVKILIVGLIIILTVIALIIWCIVAK